MYLAIELIQSIHATVSIQSNADEKRRPAPHFFAQHVTGATSARRAQRSVLASVALCGSKECESGRRGLESRTGIQDAEAIKRILYKNI